MIPKELFRKIRRIEIRTRGMVENVFGGEYHSAFKGQGIEFSEVRPYQIGDDVRDIDWNVSARTGETYVKIFEEEREQTMMLLVDVSGSEDFGSQGKQKREIAAELCAIMGFSAIQNNDKVGVLLFSDQVELFVPPGKGRRHVLRLLRDIFAHEPASRGTDIAVALERAARTLKRRSIVLLLSDFKDDSDYDRPLKMLARSHDTAALYLQDPLEEELPPAGLLDLVDAETGEHLTLDTGADAVRRTFARAAYKERARVEARLKRARIDHVPIRTDADYVEPLIRFFRQRTRLR